MNSHINHAENLQNSATRRIDIDAILTQQHGYKRPKLAVVYPWQSPFMYTRSVESLLHLQRPEGYDVDCFRGSGWSPALRHLNGCEQAMTWGANYIVIVGSDQTYPPDLLCRLVAHMEVGVEVIGCLVPTRGFLAHNDGMRPFGRVAWRFKASTDGLHTKAREYHGQSIDGDMLELINPHDGVLQRVNFIGSGVIMFRREHLEALAQPWFYEAIDPISQQRFSSMDTKFCWRLQCEAGAKVYVDVSIPIGHLHVFQIDPSFEDRFSDWAIPTPNADMDICRYLPTAVPHSTISDDAPTPTTNSGLPSSFFDRYRRDYATMSFSEHQRLYSIIERVYPEQTHFNVKASEEFFQELINHNIVPRVLEIGGWRGELANAMLSQFYDITSWHNIEICAEAVAKHVCRDQFARYTCGTGNDFFWNEKPNWIQMFNTLVLSHVVEHMRLENFAGTIAHCAAKGIDYLYLDIPHITEDSHKTWQGWTNTHVLEGGWNDIEAILTKHGYSIFYTGGTGESSRRSYASERGMVALKKEHLAHANS